VRPIQIRRVFDPFDRRGPSIASDVGATELEQWTLGPARGAQSSESARPRAAQLAEQHGLHLVIARVRQTQHSVMLSHDRAKESKPRVPPHRLRGPLSRLGAPDDDGAACPQRNSLDQLDRSIRVLARRMIEGRDATGKPRRKNGVEQNHRVETARHAKHQPIDPAQNALHVLPDPLDDRLGHQAKI
jgi:hypothetical protein